MALLRFEDALQETFAVQDVPARRYPGLINDDQTLLDDSFVRRIRRSKGSLNVVDTGPRNERRSYT